MLLSASVVVPRCDKKNSNVRWTSELSCMYSLVALTAGPFSGGYLCCGEMLTRSGSETAQLHVKRDITETNSVEHRN
jgi:hypothetical protein